MGKLWPLVAVFLFAAVALSYAADCKNARNCSSCIQTPNCIWCGKPGEFVGDSQSYVRCVNRAGSILDGWTQACGRENIHQPENYFKFLQNEKLSDSGHRSASESNRQGSWSSAQGYEENLVQLQPQKVLFQLRVDESQSLEVTFRQVADYPVDLYYLMDLSKSMEDDKDSLSDLGAQLAREMQKLTRNFRLGFGSFVDKVVMPYVSTVPEKLIAPCKHCAPPYGFRNALRLNENASLFVEKVRDAPVSGNLDAPEGGFDAIMQAIKCREQIGWRDKARHLLLFSTDAGFHYAGDGKLGGIVKPNDGECHLDSAGVVYTHSTILDYPSVAQINKVAKEENINIIFAVTAEQASVYRRLSSMVEGSSTGELTVDSSNIVELVKNEYNKITRKLIMKDNATAPVRIRYYSRCMGGEEIETNVCDNLHVGDQVNFRVVVEVDSCPEDRSLWKQVVQISPVALEDELLLEIDMLCDCECEREGHKGYEAQSSKCTGQGTYMCGVCKCDEDYLGNNCECGADTPLDAGKVDDASCRADNDTRICSGQGTCRCGTCVCNKRDNSFEVIDGPQCQCTNFLCGRQFGELCSGPDHGECVCNECVCQPGWVGAECECRNSTEECRAPGDTEDCSGNGHCECNQCQCDQTEEGGFYTGKFCEDCQSCKGKCALYEECVQCTVFGTGPLSPEECATNCTYLNVTAHSEAIAEKDERPCNFFDENDCRFVFVYGYDENKEPYVRVQQTLECPPKLDILGIVLGVIGAIVAVGLALLLMWKALTTIHDRREYAQFEKERMMAKWDTGENPIYKQATSTFKNPLYGGK